MICKKCVQDKPKIKAEPIPSSRGHYHRDNNGRLWHGNTCPDCYWPKNVGYLKEDNDESEMHFDRYFNSDPLTNNKCRKCKTFLPKSRYFRCVGCEVNGVSDAFEGLGGWT